MASTTASTSVAVEPPREYEPTNGQYVGPEWTNPTQAIASPLGDGAYWSEDVHVENDVIVFELSQKYWEDACLEHLGIPSWNSDEASKCYGGLTEPSGTSVSLAIGGTMVTIMDTEIATYRISTRELARLLRGEPPAASAPSSFSVGGSAFVVTVRNGVAVTADQAFQS